MECDELTRSQRVPENYDDDIAGDEFDDALEEEDETERQR